MIFRSRPSCCSDTQGTRYSRLSCREMNNKEPSEQKQAVCVIDLFLSQGRSSMSEPSVLSMPRDLSLTPCAKWMMRRCPTSASPARACTSSCPATTGEQGSCWPWSCFVTSAAAAAISSGTPGAALSAQLDSDFYLCFLKRILALCWPEEQFHLFRAAVQVLVRAPQGRTPAGGEGSTTQACEST